MPTEAEKRAENDRLLKSLKDEQKRLQAKKLKTKSDENRLLRLDTQIKARAYVLFRDAKTAAWTSERNRSFSAGLRTPTASTYARRVAGAAVQARKVGDGQTSPYGVSAQTKARRDQIRQMMGLGSRFEGAGFMAAVPQLDENGEPVLGPDGQPVLGGYETTGEFDGFRFGPMSAGGGQRSGSNLKGRDLSMMTGMSVKDVMDFYYSLTPDELIAVQKQMVDAGLYSGPDGQTKPSWGYRDEATEMALTTLMQTWAANPDAGLTEIMGRLKQDYSASLKPEIDKMSGVGVVSDEVANITVTDGATLDMLIDQVSVELFGQEISGEQKQSLIARLQEQERSYKMAGAQQSFDQGAAKARQEAAQTASAGGGGTAELDAFIGALIGQESGGDPNAVNSMTGAAGLGQIMGDNWGPWAREAGADPGDFSADNQMRVIRYQVAKYYQQFGNWRDVAYAWYGGGGAPAKIRSGDWSSTREQDGGYPSFDSYADSILSKMNGNLGSKLATAGAPPQQGTLSFTQNEALPDDRARIEQELRAADPARYAGTRFQKQAENFFDLLRGVGA